MRSFGSGPPLVALHGFSLTGEQFAPLAGGTGTTVLAPDLPGHGLTSVHPVTIDTVVAAVAALLAETGPAPVLGYSQGGRVALLVALAHPGLVTSLTLLSTSPGIVDRQQRLAEDEGLAADLERHGLGAFLDAWLATGPASTAHLAPVVRSADRRIREENTAEGLATAIRGFGQGAQPYLIDRLREITVPATFLAGSRDLRYAELAVEMAAAVERGRAVIVPGAGHNLLLDAPDEVATAVAEAATQA